MAKATLYLRQWLGGLAPDELNRLAVFLFPQSDRHLRLPPNLWKTHSGLFTILNNRGLPLTNSDILKSMNVGAVKKRQQTPPIRFALGRA